MIVQELRIGNCISKYTGGEMREHICSSGDIKNLEDGFTHHYEPIPLTEEWLIKFGFEKDYDCPFDFVYSMWVRDGDMEKEICAININISPKFELYNGIYSQKIESVHQLQNLYFALTGKELNYKA